MKKRFIICLMAMIIVGPSFAQQKKISVKGIYFQWGYNREFYTPSTIHFKLNDGSDFKVVHGKAHDKPDYDAI
ncbi:MAG: hypothetical protein IT254_12195, partial [Chitinophagaceae bacterium]|nr:hypothetical protein [Chitinophagaceae bacterium]